jgi:hypothetical protein
MAMLLHIKNGVSEAVEPVQKSVLQRFQADLEFTGGDKGFGTSASGGHVSVGQFSSSGRRRRRKRLFRRIVESRRPQGGEGFVLKGSNLSRSHRAEAG